jgi:S-adenosylmethionine hydrolase
MSFHGRDLFAPVAGMLASGASSVEWIKAQPCLEVRFGGDDSAEVIYIDHYGNAMTGLRAGTVSRERCLDTGGRRLRYARVFSDMKLGEAFWYENSIGLIEIAANAASAATMLDLAVGQPVAVA